MLRLPGTGRRRSAREAEVFITQHWVEQRRSGSVAHRIRCTMNKAVICSLFSRQTCVDELTLALCSTTIVPYILAVMLVVIGYHYWNIVKRRHFYFIQMLLI